MHIELSEPAFTFLESVPEKIAFEIVAALDRLMTFPEMGAPLGPRFPDLSGKRQLLYKRFIRVIYEYDEYEKNIYVFAIQNCRQKLPSSRELRRSGPDGELNLSP
jgi:hypothetical protein